MSTLSRHRWIGALSILPFVACAETREPSRLSVVPAAITSASAMKRPLPGNASPERNIFDKYLAAHPNLTADQVLATIPKRPYVEALSFDPSTAAYYKEVTDALQLTDQERSILQKQGFVSVDHRRHASMGSMYFDIYIRDLPVLITTDSIAHALHRSYDHTLKTLEERIFLGTIDRLLASTHDVLVKESAGLTDADVLATVHDVDLYLSVARNLLGGMGAPPGDVQSSRYAPPITSVTSRFGQDKQVQELLARIASLELETPDVKKTAIYGGKRAIDWSQFKPRGHYTESDMLKRYFRVMMWLGRADIGWNLLPPLEISGIESDTARERRNAAVLSYVMDKSGQLPRLRAMSNIIDFLVGRGDSLSVDAMGTVLPQLQVTRLADFGSATVAQRLELAVKQMGLGKQRIASQTLASDPSDPTKTAAPPLFQVFGQRFVIDSFVLGQLVFDSIIYGGKKQERAMPQGIDVFAAMGNDEALRLVEPELRIWNFGSNLMASRAVIDGYSAANWGESVYNTWLDALRSLDDPFPAASKAPQAMRTRQWQHKQLETQLASWAELRHDTILYVKQSYSSVTACAYPAGYVEPYPVFFERLRNLGTEAARLLAGADVSDPDPTKSQEMAEIRKSMVMFWTEFSATMKQLQILAQKELAAQPFTSDEQAFIKKTIDIRGGGSGPPRYDGWFPKLIYGGDPAKWKPTVADVHTDPTNGEVLQVGVGDVTFLVAAIDNEGDKMVYVGPMSSYYEFRQPAQGRMTDEEWRTKAESFDFPARPAWSSSVHPQLTAPAKERTLGRPPQPSTSE